MITVIHQNTEFPSIVRKLFAYIKIERLELKSEEQIRNMVYIYYVLNIQIYTFNK